MKDTKVFRVNTGIVEKNDDNVLEDTPNFSTYVVTAKDAEEAIKKAKKRFIYKTKEYVSSVEKIITLEE